MGIFKDFATSGYGDFTIGALQGLAEAGERDAAKNAVFAEDSLNKENAAFAKTELAFNNKKQITNIIAENPLAFGITATADLTANQIADRLTNKIFNEQRSIFENSDFNKVKVGVANYLTRPGNIGTGIELTSPYVPSEDLFKAEEEKHALKLSEISKTPRVDKLLMNIKKVDEEVATPEAITDSLTKVAGITAKGYGILNTFPGTYEGNINLKFVQTNIIVANAKAQFPNDVAAREQFIDKKLYDNNIDPLDGIEFMNRLTFKTITKVVDTQASLIANSIVEKTNAMAQAKTEEERIQIQDSINKSVLQSYQILNTFSQSAPKILAGRDKSLVEGTTDFNIPQGDTQNIAADYVPSIDSTGALIIERADGQTSKIPFEELVNNSTSFQLLPTIAQNYVSTIENSLFKNGNMIKPTRNMFNDGPAGDKAFRDFLNLYNKIESRKEMSLEELGDYGVIKSPVSIIDPTEEKERIRQEFKKEKAKTKDADIGQFKDTTQTSKPSQKKKL